MFKKLGLLLFFSIVLGILIFVAYKYYVNDSSRSPNVKQINYSEFIAAINQGNVKQVEIGNENVLTGYFCSGGQFLTYAANDPHMLDDLIQHKVSINIKPKTYFSSEWLFATFVSIWIPILLQTAILAFCIYRCKPGGKQ
jgi:cell division protease FtsH